MKDKDLKKQLLYRSIHRGCKETDFLVGEFAKAELEKIADLELFGNFIEEDDARIYDWILDKVTFPEKYENLIKDIRSFHKI